MKKPREWNSVEIDLWRESIEMSRLREDILGLKDYGRDIEGLRINEGIREEDDES